MFIPQINMIINTGYILTDRFFNYLATSGEFIIIGLTQVQSKLDSPIIKIFDHISWFYSRNKKFK